MKVTTIYDAAYEGTDKQPLYEAMKALLVEGVCPDCLEPLTSTTVNGQPFGQCDTKGPSGLSVYWSADERSISKGEVFK